MAKDKKGSKAAAPAPKAAVSKPIESVKAGRVTKPVESTKAVAKEAAKKVAKGVKKGSKKVEKTLTPESSDDEDTSASSESSDDEKDVKVKAEPVSTSKAKSKNVSDSESDSDASSSSDSENDAAKVKKAPKVNGAGKVGSDADGSSSSGSDSSDGSDSEDDAPKVNGKAGSASSDDSDSDSGSDSDSSSSGSDDEVNAKAGAAKDAADGTSDASSSGSDSEEDEEPLPKIKVDESSKKRKAEDTFGQTPKKTKVMIEGEQKEATANLFIGNLSWNIDEEWLTREFEEFGEIKGVRVITDRDSGRSKGFGYVEFVDVDSAVQALEAKTGGMLDGRNIRIDFSQPRQQKDNNFTPQQRSNDRAQRYGDTPKEPSKTLFVGNVSFDADESMLTELFQDYGTITAVRLPTDKMTEQLKGFGYVEFTSIDEAKAAYDSLQGAEISNRPIRLDFASERSSDSPRGGGFSRGAPRGRGGFGDRGGRGGRGGFSDRGGRGGFGDRGRGRGGRGGTTNRGGFGDFSGKKTSFG